MLLISHRGNIFGIDKEKENSPKQIEHAIKQGYDVEIDVWSYDFRWFLGILTLFTIIAKIYGAMQRI